MPEAPAGKEVDVQIVADKGVIDVAAERAVLLTANHASLPPRLAAAFADVDAATVGGEPLQLALAQFTLGWGTALDCFVDDARTITEALREVDRRYVETEMAITTAFLTEAEHTASGSDGSR